MKPKPTRKALSVTQELTKRKTIKKGAGGQEMIPTDVLGSYTGLQENGDKPIQDADDL